MAFDPRICNGNFIVVPFASMDYSRLIFILMTPLSRIGWNDIQTFMIRLLMRLPFKSILIFNQYLRLRSLLALWTSLYWEVLLSHLILRLVNIRCWNDSPGCRNVISQMLLLGRPTVSCSLGPQSITGCIIRLDHQIFSRRILLDWLRLHWVLPTVWREPIGTIHGRYYLSWIVALSHSC